MNHLCMENDTTGKLGESKVWFDHPEWWLSTDDGCCHTEIRFCPYCGINLFIKQVVNRSESKNDLSGYLGLLEIEKHYDPRTVAHLTKEVSTMKKENVQEMIELCRVGNYKLHPDYLQILLSRLEENN